VPLGEFDLIEQFFGREAGRRDVLLGVGDDAALLTVPAGSALVAATDTLVEGRHFLPDAPADSVGHQVLAVNLSDLAAMGAEPAWALLSLSLPAADPAWLAPFAEGLYALAGLHGVALVGGDTVRGPRVVTITALGFVEPALALRRDGARPGDLLFVSGWPGEAAAGLELLRQGACPPDDPLVRRCRYAEPRVALGLALRGRVSAAMDVSDGLLGDLAKLCASSGVGAVIDLERLPVSGELARRHPAAECERLVLTGGDDYELLFTVSEAVAAGIDAIAPPGLPLHRIGRIEAGRAVRCQRDGRPVRVPAGGYDHFA
jgi:thiamine-monophosphate kinase